MSNFRFEFSYQAGPSQIQVSILSLARSVALRSPSGSGKSTFIRVISGLQKTSSGEFLKASERIGYVPQDSLLIPTMTVRENLLLSPRSSLDQLSEIASHLKIEPLLDRRPRLLSGGEKQRVSIGRALMSRPELLIMDEPFAALDFNLRAEISAYLKEWSKTHNVRLILVSHDENSATDLCEEIWTIDGNKLFQQGLHP